MSIQLSSTNYLVIAVLTCLISLNISVQGPLSAPVLQHLTKEDLSKLYFGEFQVLDINGSLCYLTRTGYVALFGSSS